MTPLMIIAESAYCRVVQLDRTKRRVLTVNRILRVLGTQPCVAPPGDRHDHISQFAAHLGQAIFDVGWDFADLNAAYQTALFKHLETAAECTWIHSTQGFLQFTKAPRTTIEQFCTICNVHFWPMIRAASSTGHRNVCRSPIGQMISGFPYGSFLTFRQVKGSDYAKRKQPLCQFKILGLVVDARNPRRPPSAEAPTMWERRRCP